MDDESTRRYREYLASNIAQSRAAATNVTTTASGQQRHFDAEDQRMHEKRVKVLARGRKLAIAILVMSFLSVALGLPGVFLTEKWPHMSGGGIVMGVMCIPGAIWYMYMHHYHRRLGENTQYLMDRRFHFLAVFAIFLAMVGFFGQIYGIATMAWSVEDCRNRLVSSCNAEEHANTLLALGACLVTLTVFLFFAMYCMCDTVAGNLEEFGMRPGIRGYPQHHAYEFCRHNNGQLPYEAAFGLQESASGFGNNYQGGYKQDSDSSDDDKSSVRQAIATSSVAIQDVTPRTVLSRELPIQNHTHTTNSDIQSSVNQHSPSASGVVTTV